MFLTVRMDLSKNAVQRAARRQGKLPVWLEQRAVHSRKLLWRKRLAGYPPGLSRVVPHRGRSLTLVFSRRGNIPFGIGEEKDDDRNRFLRSIPRLRVTVPIRSGPMQEPLPPVVYRKPYK